ncbi:MAG TPA: DNA-3-methyladenine glycosylase [Anaerolineales bacterium]|nr:DNA-3-methyladenine glycosylase [Anaerolineales bacterium]
MTAPASAGAARRVPRLRRPFFDRPTLDVARDLLGKRLVRIERGRRRSGWIVEAEAYVGPSDLGCHAHVGRTARNEVMWGPPGHAYVYFTYGMHWCLNFVTEREGFPAAVLIRALLPEEGLRSMQRRRGDVPLARLLDGPAKLTQALAIDGALNGHDLCGPAARLFVESLPHRPRGTVTTGPRVGLNNVPEPWKSRPWRFRLAPEDVRPIKEHVR